jgi:preprotein translocase subunit SecD
LAGIIIKTHQNNLGGKAMSLGLDLRGGVHFLLEVDMHAVMAMSIDKHYNELRTLLRAERLYKSIKKEDERIVIRLKTADSKDRALKIISSELSDLVVLESNNKDEPIGTLPDRIAVCGSFFSSTILNSKVATAPKISLALAVSCTPGNCTTIRSKPCC